MSSIVHVLGAGVDRPLGMPLAQELLAEVAKFANGPGEPIVRALRSQLPNLRFNLSKYAGEQGETFAERLLTNDSHGLELAKDKLVNYLNKAQNPVSIVAILEVIEALEYIRDKNKIGDDALRILARLGNESFQPSGGDFILDPRGIHFVPIIRQAFRKTFQSAMQTEDVTDQEKDILIEMALWMMNVEDLLGTLFSGFYTQHIPGQKKYIYFAWLLWSYLRVKMQQIDATLKTWPYSNYSQPSQYISLNYTAEIFPEDMRKDVQFFHGDCSSYIRLDTRQLLKQDDRVRRANSPDTIAEFIDSLEMDIDNRKIFIPGIIPPLSFKPLICREYLETWYKCGQLFDDASAIIITGYSFALADEHFNDLIRKCKRDSDSKIIVINPDINTVAGRVCMILGWDLDQLTNINLNGFDCKTAFNLTLVKAKVEELNPDVVSKLIG